ncbi:sugar phosphate isomerase/epimerase family protein [uncultured Draconibacterium sp.]|mgnify:CR=1 FL=1|uniref:sugar phosphate isomerase/epimerase family protein n=1 Tax=uncultured Draconibacterium sp. TaxID=1573823 RepID=UPI0025FB3E22|nr:sugar phosphate isomerase/epimerase family protein [uncultured Draconibacterium sp.]
MQVKRFLFIIGLCFISVLAIAQNADNNYQRPLSDVLKDIEQQYDVKLRISGDPIDGLVLDYANWRFRPDVNVTLKNVLAPFDLIHIPDGAPNKFKIQGYRYHQRSVEDAKATLESISEKYSNKTEWEKRRSELKACVKEAIRLKTLPASPGTKPILTDVRKMDGYTVQNIGLEVLPGFYVAGSIYRPTKIKGKIPVILCPNGHFNNGRYHEQIQTRCAGLARMGALAVSYDLFGWGESALQVGTESHRTSMANTMQALNSIRLLDYLLSFDYADESRVGITGGSGGGSHTILISAIDDRIDVSVPTVMMSAIHYGGCPCESGNPIHFCGGGTNNVELGGLFAPKPQLVISDGGDWTANVPELEFPFLKRIYDFYDGAVVENIHFADEGHDYGPSKRTAMYRFMAKHLGLDASKVFDKKGKLDESFVAIESEEQLKSFGTKGENLPGNALKSFDDLVKVFNKEVGIKAKSGEYKIAVCDWMILKRQKLGVFERAYQIGADGIELDMGGLGNRPTWDNKMLNPIERKIFLDKLKEYKLEFSSVAMSGFYAQPFYKREGLERLIDDCINTMNLIGVKTAFLPLGVEGDLNKYPERREAIVERLQMAGKKAEAAGVVIGIETSLDAAGEIALLEEIGSPAIKIYYNFQNPLEAGRDLHQELKLLGKDRICQIHCTDTDGVWLENNTRLDMHKVKETLDEMGYSGWLVIERSRDATRTKASDVVWNYGGNTKFLKSIFQE